MVLRSILPSDDPHLAVIVRNTFHEFEIDTLGTVYMDAETDHLSDVFRAPGSLYWVAEEEGKILGGCGLYPTDGLPPGYAELVKFYLDPQARGKGVGRALMDKTMESAKELGYTNIYLESFPSLTTAIGMYERMGFTRRSESLGNSGHFACNVWMEKEIDER